MQATTSRLGAIAVATALVTLLVTIFFAYQDWRQYGVAFAKTNEARRLLGLNVTLLDRMRDAETAQREFLLTGRPEYLEPYNIALDRIPAETGELAVSPQGAIRSTRPIPATSVANRRQTGRIERDD